MENKSLPELTAIANLLMKAMKQPASKNVIVYAADHVYIELLLDGFTHQWKLSHAEMMAVIAMTL